MAKRGASSGFSSGVHGRMRNLIQSFNQNVTYSGGNWQYNGTYDNNGNPELVKYQGQDDDKTANFLASTERNVDFANYDDGYAYHDIPLNRLLLRLGVSGGPTVLSDANFDAYVQQTGQQTMYRGWSGDASAQRFMSAKNNHVGNGRYGDGYYFTPDLSTARVYGNTVMRMALSPNARVISYNDLLTKMHSSSGKLQKALHYAGTGGSGRTYGSNNGEAQYALKLGYNVVDMGGGYLYGITSDAFVVSKKLK